MVELFPTSVLDNSILTSVVLGLLITWVFQETLGWNFTGLVVPGYLASIFAIQPDTGGVVVVEAGLTYGFVYVLSELAPTHWPTSRLFGRDRFFALLVASVTVRLVVEGVGLDVLAAWLGRPLSPTLHSMGLLVMPLGANALWRTGMARGVVRLGVPVLLTYLILTWVLLPFSNLSMTSFELAYEDLAVDFVTSPKAYMLLLAGAWLGSVTNREYGFDYGGIIVPGLLAVCWMWPSRVFSTFGEALAVWALMSVVVRLPGLRNANLAGGRTLVLAFVMVYCVKFVLGWTVGLAWPGARVRDLFGFGYLLPTLMGLRMYRHGEPFRFLVPTAVCSLAAFVGAGVVGFGLGLLLPEEDSSKPQLVEESTLVLAAWANEGPMPSRAEMERSVSGGQGFGALSRRTGEGPALVARIGPSGLGQGVLDLAAVVDARAVLLCGPKGPGCEVAERRLREEGVVWRVEATVRSYLQARADDLYGVDMTRLTRSLPELVLRPGAMDTTRLGLGIEPRSRRPVREREAGPTLLRADENAPTLGLGASRAVRFELAPALARFDEGDALAEGRAARAAAWFEWGVERSGSVLTVAGPDLHAQVRAGGKALILHVPEAENPGILPLALQLGSALGARAIVQESAPRVHEREAVFERPAFSLLTGLAEQWPDAVIVELRGLRDVQDINASWGWSTGWPRDEVPVVVEELSRLLGSAPAGFAPNANHRALRRPYTPLRHVLPRGQHVVVEVDTRLRHRFVAFAELEGLPRRWATLGTPSALPDWAQRWDLPVRSLLTRRDLDRLRPQLVRAEIDIGLACTRLDQCGWTTLKRCVTGECEEVWIPRYRGLEDGSVMLSPSALGRR